MSFRSSTSCFCFKIKRAQSIDGVWEGAGDGRTPSARANGTEPERFCVCCTRIPALRLQIQTNRAAEMGSKQPCKREVSRPRFFTRADRSTSEPEEEKTTKALKESRHSFYGQKENLHERAGTHTTQASLEHVATSRELTDSHVSHEIWIHPFCVRSWIIAQKSTCMFAEPASCSRRGANVHDDVR